MPIKLKEWWTYTAIPTYGRQPLGKKIQVPMYTAKTKRMVQYHCPEFEGFFCMDVSWNVCSATGEEDHLQLHWHGVGRGMTEEGKLGLITAFKRDGDPCHKPLLTKLLTDLAGQLAYLSKLNFCRRTSLVNKDGQRNTRIEPLSLREEVLLAHWLSPYRVEHRFFSIGDTFADFSAVIKNNPNKSNK